MAKNKNKSNAFNTTPEAVEQEVSKENFEAEKTADQTNEDVENIEGEESTNDQVEVPDEETVEGTPDEETVEETQEETNTDEPEQPVFVDDRKKYEVDCDQLYLRPEPNKKAIAGILSKGNILYGINEDEKLPEGWLAVETDKEHNHISGYVMKEFVKTL